MRLFSWRKLSASIFPGRIKAQRSPRRWLRQGVATAACAVATWSAAGSAVAQTATAQSPKPTFWIIPHTHWEGAVFKTREDYLEMGLPHILTAVRLLKEHPEYRFSLDQVAYIRPFLERYPEEVESFRKFVKEGRLQIVCGLDIMPDDNMPSGESFIRQMLYAKSYVREALGVEVKVGWLLDTFGHHAQMPQLLRQAGYDSFWFFRGVEDFKTARTEFLWEGLDGTRIPAFWLPFGYGHAYGPPKELPKFADFMKKRFDSLQPFTSATADRVGLAGVDVSEPELYVPALVERFNREGSASFTLRLGVPTDFEKATAKRADLTVLKGERNPLFQGIYSSRIELKQWMRSMESDLGTAERLGAMAWWLGAPVDHAMTWRAWEPVLFNVTHDLASGVMTDYVYEDTVRSYEFSKRLADEMLRTREDRILDEVDTRGEGVALVVFNTLGWARTDVAEGDVGFAEAGVVDFDLVDAAGGPVAAQLTAVERFEDGGLRRVKFAFVAREVPSMGHAVYHLKPRKTAGASKAAVTVAEASGAMENERLKVRVDLRTGALLSARVKAGDWEALSGPGNVVALEKDEGDFWELYKNLDGGQNVIMTRPLPQPKRGEARFSDEFGKTAGTLVRGPVFEEALVQHALGTNAFTSRTRVYQGLGRIDFETRIRNQERFVRYRAIFPTTIAKGTRTDEIPFGAVERPLSQEFPAQNWIDYGGRERGVALINRGMPGNNVADGALMLSLARATSIRFYGEGGGYEKQGSDSGQELGRELTLRYSLAPHNGDWREAGVVRSGQEFNTPLIVRKARAHAGRLGASWGWLKVGPSNVVVSAVKTASDGSTVVRVYESEGRAVQGATLAMNAKVMSAAQANLIEDSGARAAMADGAVKFDLRPFEIKTFKLKLQTAKR